MLDVRALLPLVEIETLRRSTRILNEDEKTVLIIHMDEIKIVKYQKKTPLINLITLQPIRGYSQYLHQLHRALSSAGLKEEKNKICGF